jgi:hypothetical protein
MGPRAMDSQICGLNLIAPTIPVLLLIQSCDALSSDPLPPPARGYFPRFSAHLIISVVCSRGTPSFVVMPLFTDYTAALRLPFASFALSSFQNRDMRTAPRISVLQRRGFDGTGS